MYRRTVPRSLPADACFSDGGRSFAALLQLEVRAGDVTVAEAGAQSVVPLSGDRLRDRQAPFRVRRGVEREMQILRCQRERELGIERLVLDLAELRERPWRIERGAREAVRQIVERDAERLRERRRLGDPFA